MTLIETIELKLKEVSAVKNYAEGQVKSSPDGALNIKREKGKLRYYCRESKAETCGKYLGQDCKKTIKGLENKEYCAKLEKVAAKQEESLLRIKDLLGKMPDYKTVYLTVPEDRRHLIAPCVYCDKEQDKRLQDWERKRKKQYSDNKNGYVTQNGEHVRSKSELIIADRLKAAGVPYYYENSLGIEYKDVGHVAYFWPDFTVLNLRTGEELIWEHFGMLDNPDYCEGAQIKIKNYADNGYWLGRNLIITTESSKHPLNTKYVDMVINNYCK